MNHQHQDVKEASVVRPVYSVISQITYVASFCNWYTAKKAELSTHIRRTHKIALGLPHSTRMELLLQLGIHNMLAELIEARKVLHLEDLTKTQMGRIMLDKLRITDDKQHGDKTTSIREKLQVANLPKNMHPELSQGRRVVS